MADAVSWPVVLAMVTFLSAAAMVLPLWLCRLTCPLAACRWMPVSWLGFCLLLALPTVNSAMPVLDGEAVVALGDEVGVLPGGNGEVLAGGEDVVFGGELGDAGRGGELEPGLRPGGDGAGAALGGFDAFLPRPPGRPWLAVALMTRFGLLQAVDGGELVGLGVALQGGVLFVGDVGQATAEGSGFLCLGDRFAAVEVGATGVGSGVGASSRPWPARSARLAWVVEFAAVAPVG